MKKTFDEISKYFKEHDCELLESEYLNAHEKMKYRCSCGNISFIHWNNFKSGRRCGCRRIGAQRFTEFQVKNEVESLGFSFVSSKFVNNQHIVKCVCKCGVLREVQLKSIRRSDGCFTCRNQNFALKYQEVFDYFAQHNCKLLEKEYKNARTKLKYICSCGSESSIVFDSFKRGNRCRKCGNKKNSLQQRLSQEEVTKQFSDHGCVLQDKYKKASTPLKFICKCGRQGLKSLNNFKKMPRCKSCSLQARSGQNHYEWISDRKMKIEYDLFRDKCYKMLKIVLGKFGGIKSKRTEEMLGFSPEELIAHISGHPNWSNLKNERWHLDHIFPIKAFFDYSIKDLKLINCLENLQPLTAKQNCVKNCKYDAVAFENWLQSKGVKVTSCLTKGQV
jgi:hypothetical protein